MWESVNSPRGYTLQSTVQRRLETQYRFMC